MYDGHDSQEAFAMELEKALDSCCAVIVIEPSQLGDETARWITAGNVLHKMAAISGFSSLVTGKDFFLLGLDAKMNNNYELMFGFY